jgi:2-polyprenyl-3-methyl-5-hydroxy-6-metoxy-1,4-benzoquinol methylase
VSKSDESYFSRVNPDLLNKIPLSAQRVIEIGCGTGELARTYLQKNPTSTYFGVELNVTAAETAKKFLSHVIVGDIESDTIVASIEQIAKKKFDALVMGDVLEHLREPEQVLSNLRRLMAPDGVCVMCVPNVSHWSLLIEQLNGRWNYGDEGLLDRTHLRFFTLQSLVKILENSGWSLIDATPRILWGEKTKSAINMFAPVAESLNIKPDALAFNLSAYQWIIRAINGKPKTHINVAALGLKKIAGVTEARVDHPLAALSTLPWVRVNFSEEHITIPGSWDSGILILHRQIINNLNLREKLSQKIREGWIIVSDIDDDPRAFEEYKLTNYFAFRGVHAVTVSTPALADLIREWNPNVVVFANAIPQLRANHAKSFPKSGERIRIFFGALNRKIDWFSIKESIFRDCVKIAEKIEFVVVHDREVFDSIPDAFKKTFCATLPIDQYMEVLESCDFALLPLIDNQFNKYKSDLKFIECCAAGVIPICSDVVYGDTDIKKAIGLFPESNEQWGAELLKACTSPEVIMNKKDMALSFLKNSRMHCNYVSEREAFFRSLISNRDSLERERQRRISAHFLSTHI